MIAQICGISFLAFAAVLAVRGFREFQAGFASLKFKWTYPKLESDRVRDPLGFWLLVAAKLLLVATLGYLGLQLMVGS